MEFELSDHAGLVFWTLYAIRCELDDVWRPAMLTSGKKSRFGSADLAPIRHVGCGGGAPGRVSLACCCVAVRRAV